MPAINNQNVPVMWKPQNGGLNSDQSLKDIAGGDMPDALNIRAMGDGGNVSMDYENIIGNHYEDKPDDVSVQDQQTLITIDVLDLALGYTADFIFSHTNGPVICSFNSVIVGNDFAATAVNILADIDANLVVLGYSYTSVVTATSVTTGTILITIIDLPGLTGPTGFSWSLKIIPLNDDLTFTPTIIREGYDLSMLGYWNDLRGENLVDSTMKFWTTQRNLSESFDIITDVIDDGTGLIQLEVTDSTGFIVGHSIRVSGVVGTVPATDLLSESTNGIWIISFIDATHITLAGSVFPVGAVYDSGGLIYNNIYGLGQIGVLVEDVNTDTISYTTLLISKEFNFRTPYQIDSRSDLSTSKRETIYTDNFNPPRAFYYVGAYTTNGALTINNPLNIYEYGLIGSESKLILNSINTHLTFTSQTQSGGNLVAGNAIYFTRLLTKTLEGTEWSECTNDVPSFSSSTNGNPLYLWGDAEGDTTGKVNNFLLSNIPVGLYFYVELAVVQFIGQAINAFIVRRDVLIGNTTQQLQHTGFEVGSEPLDAGLLLFRNADIATARNVNILDSRVILSDITLSSSYDFTDFCKTVRHSIERVSIDGVGNEMEGEYRLGEYFEPENVCFRASLMLNECYRFGFKFKLKEIYGGITTQPFWVDDILINCENYNIDPAYPDNRRDASLTMVDYDLTTGDAIPKPYCFYITFQGFDLNYLINDIPFIELVESIIPVRVDMIQDFREVMASGIVIPAVNATMEAGGGAGEALYYVGAGVFGSTYGEFPLITGHNFFGFNGYGGGFIPDNQDYPTATFGILQYTARRRFGSFYWMDNILGGDIFDYLADDYLLIYGNTLKSIAYPSISPVPSTYMNQYFVYNGVTGVTTLPTPNVIVEAIYCNDAVTPHTFGSGEEYSKNLKLRVPVPGADRQWIQPNGFIFKMTSDILDNNGAGNFDYGIYTTQYYRPKSTYDVNYNPDTSKFGNRSITQYITTGAYLDINSDTPNPVVQGDFNVYGGDVFTQKTFFKHRYPTGKKLGFGGGVAIYTQNRFNTQMRFSIDPLVDPYPVQLIYEWLDEKDAARANNDPALHYNTSYNLRNNINTEHAFDPLLLPPTNLETTFIWSAFKSDTSISDEYRIFPPGNIKTLSASNGSITDHLIANEQLISIQQRLTQRLFFNTNGVLTTTEGAEVIFGSGAVMQRKGQILSTYGSKHKWSCGLGKSKGGHDLIFYFDAENKVIMRIGYDGSVPISDEHNMRTFLKNNTAWVFNNDTPADNYGVHFVWNQEFLEAIWTFRGKREVPEWDDTADYDVGEIVNLSDNSVFSTFEQFDTIYICISDSSAGIRPDSDTLLWARIPVTDNRYYNFYTLVWSEKKNVFQCRHTYRPRIYTLMKNFIGSTRPVGDTGRWYKHNKGNLCQWYDDGVTSQIEDGFICPVVNKPEGVLTFASQQVDCAVPVFRLEHTTANHISWVDAPDIDYLENKAEGQVHQDATVTLDPKADGGELWGDYMVTKVVFQALNYQRVSNMITKVWVRANNWLGRN